MSSTAPWARGRVPSDGPVSSMRGGNRFWWRWLATTALVFGAAWALLVGLDTGPRPGRLLLLVALLMAVLALVTVSTVGDGPEWTVHTTQPVAEPGQDVRLGMYARVIAGHLDARQVDTTLRDRLADLADRRLRQRHGLTLRDPGTADLLGLEVAEILTGPARRLTRRQIESCVAGIEAL
jgi:hypothetical protein